MFVTAKRLMPDYEKHRAATDKDCVIDVKEFMKMTSEVNHANCPVCHGSGASPLMQCQAIMRNGVQCKHEALNLLNGTNKSKYYLCGRHMKKLAKLAGFKSYDGDDEE